MGHYPDHKTYRALYARYYSGRDVAELLRLLEPLDGMRVLDLCGGDGRLALAALEKGAGEADLVDASESMVAMDKLKLAHVRAHVREVHDALLAMRMWQTSFDRIACRQAVNYWLNETTAGLTARVLRPGGIFAFNTFNRKPSERPRVLQYDFEGHRFMEVSWLVGETVHHVQVRSGMSPHSTSFTWLAPKKLRSMLGQYFKMTVERHGRTSLYRCEKK